MNLLTLLNKIFKPTKKQALAHRETSFTILSGLITQAPIIVFIMYCMREVFNVTDWWVLSMVNISSMTVISYIRLYYTRMYFSGRYDDIEERHEKH
jgi:hypothetical protein